MSSRIGGDSRNGKNPPKRRVFACNWTGPISRILSPQKRAFEADDHLSGTIVTDGLERLSTTPTFSLEINLLYV